MVTNREPETTDHSGSGFIRCWIAGLPALATDETVKKLVDDLEIFTASESTPKRYSMEATAPKGDGIDRW